MTGTAIQQRLALTGSTVNLDSESNRPVVMGKPQQSLGRSYLVSKLRARGYSRRQSVVIVNVILERMKPVLERAGRTE